MTELWDHPGYLGITSEGVIAIHADWPTYPEEHGWHLALLWLTALPKLTPFTLIDDIDRCSLLLAVLPNTNHDAPLDRTNLHVAVWHTDVLELLSRGYVTGVRAVGERRWQKLRRRNIPEAGHYMKLEDGTYIQVSLPPLDDYEDEDLCWPEFQGDGVRVTTVGWPHAERLLAGAPIEFGGLSGRIRDLVELRYFDAATREACVALEDQMKTWLESSAWGNRLVDEFIIRIRSSGRFLGSHLKVLRGQIRTTFKFIRNDVMHNLVEMDETQCRSLLLRIARAKAAVDHVVACT